MIPVIDAGKFSKYGPVVPVNQAVKMEVFYVFSSNATVHGMHGAPRFPGRDGGIILKRWINQCAAWIHDARSAMATDIQVFGMFQA